MGTFSLSQSGDTWKTILSSVEATESLGYVLGCQLTGGEIITLRGELGAGKTSLMKGVASGIEVDPQVVTSPTFTFIHEYPGRIYLIHADLYRINNPLELESIGFHEYFQATYTIAIEWPERMGNDLPNDRLEIHLEHIQPTTRKATLWPTGPRSHLLLSKITSQGT